MTKNRSHDYPQGQVQDHLDLIVTADRVLVMGSKFFVEITISSMKLWPKIPFSG